MDAPYGDDHKACDERVRAEGYAKALAELLGDILDRIGSTDDYKLTEYIVACCLFDQGNDYQDMLWRILRHLELANRELADEVEEANRVMAS